MTSQLSSCRDTVSDIHNLKEERFNLANGFRGSSSCCAGSKAGALLQVEVAEQRWFARKQSTATAPERKGWERRCRPQGCAFPSYPVIFKSMLFPAPGLRSSNILLIQFILRTLFWVHSFIYVAWRGYSCDRKALENVLTDVNMSWPSFFSHWFIKIYTSLKCIKTSLSGV